MRLRRRIPESCDAIPHNRAMEQFGGVSLNLRPNKGGYRK